MNEERLRRIQAALREEKLDAWFLADFRGADPISLHILGLQGRPMVTRRWFYVIPAQGDPAPCADLPWKLYWVETSPEPVTP